MEYRLVDGADFASPASALLQAAWRPPALFYSAEYLRWQLSFPGPVAPPAAAAFDGVTLVGFAATTHRRVRFHGDSFDTFVVSFAAVHPGYRSQGVAARLYAVLLGAIGDAEIPVVTYGQAESAGKRLIERVYPDGGFQLRSLGTYPVYGHLVRSETDTQRWAAGVAGEEQRSLRSVLEGVADQNDWIYSDPSGPQSDHYRQGPGDPVLFVQRNTENIPVGAAWARRATHVGPHGVHSVPALDCIWLRHNQADCLSGLASAAAIHFSGSQTPRGVVVQASGLQGFEPEAIRRAGFRQIAAPFHVYVAATDERHPLLLANGLNLEMV